MKRFMAERLAERLTERKWNKWWQLPSRLHTRLTLILLALFLITAATSLGVVLWSSGLYYQEITQRLNSNLAMYIAQRTPLIVDGKVNQDAMVQLANQAMIINPIAEVYLLDNAGHILSHALPKDAVTRTQVDLSPIQAFIGSHARLPIKGDDPRHNDRRRVFSAYPIVDQGQRVGYLYVLLGGEIYQTLADTLQGSYILRTSIALVILVAFFSFGAATVLFARLTRPLRKLASDADQVQQSELYPARFDNRRDDEMVRLRAAFDAMQTRIKEQMERLQETDNLRRELISNVSHDLRTPLASMQGYLETLLLKENRLDSEARKRYLLIAWKHTQRLTRLVTELFELSKLDAGRVVPHFEHFSLAELLQDVAQKFQLEAEQKQIVIGIEGSDGLYPVYADIALIERVLENLVTNALRYTPEGGRVNLNLVRSENEVLVNIADSGKGIASEDLPNIFERYYQGKNTSEHVKLQENTPDLINETRSGLGLAIVKRILELHGSKIEVISNPLSGTCFVFPLPAQAA